MNLWLVVKSRWSVGTWIWVPKGAETLCSHLAILCGTESCSGLTQFCINMLWSLCSQCSHCSVQLFFLKLTCGDLALTVFQIFTWTSYFHCFEHLELSQGPNSAICAGLVHWSDCSNSIASKIFDLGWQHYFLNCWKYRKNSCQFLKRDIQMLKPHTRSMCLFRNLKMVFGCLKSGSRIRALRKLSELGRLLTASQHIISLHLEPCTL